MSAFGTKRLRCKCPLLGVERTCRFALHMSAFDPKRTLFVMLAISPPVSRLPYQRIHFVLEKRAAN